MKGSRNAFLVHSSDYLWTNIWPVLYLFCGMIVNPSKSVDAKAHTVVLLMRLTQVLNPSFAKLYITSERQLFSIKIKKIIKKLNIMYRVVLWSVYNLYSICYCILFYNVLLYWGALFAIGSINRWKSCYFNIV